MKCVVCLKKSLCLYSIWSSLPIANCHMHAAWHLLAVAVATVHGGCSGGHMATYRRYYRRVSANSGGLKQYQGSRGQVYGTSLALRPGGGVGWVQTLLLNP